MSLSATKRLIQEMWPRPIKMKGKACSYRGTNTLNLNSTGKPPEISNLFQVIGEVVVEEAHEEHVP